MLFLERLVPDIYLGITGARKDSFRIQITVLTALVLTVRCIWN
jgi:hypothetical protein